MSKLQVTDFANKAGSPFSKSPETEAVVHEERLQKTQYDLQKERQTELTDRANRKSAEIQANRPADRDGCFTEVVAHGAFTTKANNGVVLKPTTKNLRPNGTKSLLGYPSSANDLALDAKTDLESDPAVPAAVKEKVIEKLFALVSMVQHTYESKVRLMAEFDKFKDVHLRSEARRERQHAEQLYQLSMSFQSEVVQAIQQIKSELDIGRSGAKDSEGEQALDVNGDSQEGKVNPVLS